MLNLAHDQDVGSASKNRIASLEEQVQVLTKKLKDLGAAAKAKVRQKKEKKRKKKNEKKKTTCYCYRHHACISPKK